MKVLGTRLRKWRFSVGMTLADAAARVGISKGYLSRIENGIASPSIAVLNQLSAAYGAPLSKLMETGGVGAAVSVVRASERLPINRDGGEHGYQYALVNHRMADRRAECFVVDMPPVEEAIPMFTHAGEEMFFILSGRVRFVYGGVEHILEAGDCIYFDATVEHRGLAHGGAPATALAVIVPPATAQEQEKGVEETPPDTGDLKEETQKCAS
ncbi:MAG: helix-turn-helix transcriptional regulator [Rhodospirillaceae bacterium]|nr:helix-turn-helix transcriptional regulator [Rhodospirillaceae bacterium]